jgi:DNA-binding MarR family transcriptional regulator
MTAKLRDEIRQGKPFASAEVEAYLNLLRTSDALVHGVEEMLKPSGLTQTQYNVLRILRGAGSEGLVCRELSERMVARDPDITRLLDRLEARRLVTRMRDRKDRRAITVRITGGGVRLVGRLDQPIAMLHRRQLSHMGQGRIRQLIRLLEQARQKIE